MKLSPSSSEGSDAIPYMRYGHSASAIGDLVYIFGGRNDTHGACNTLFCFDTGKGNVVMVKDNFTPPLLGISLDMFVLYCRV